LFGYISTKSYIKNIKVTDAYVSGDSWVGGVVGTMNGVLENYHFSGRIEGKFSYIGGIVGQSANGLISGCSNSSTISGSNILTFCGGIVGWVSSGGIAGMASDIRYCSNAGTISGKTFALTLTVIPHRKDNSYKRSKKTQ